MLNTLTTFEKLLQEHEVIQANIKHLTGAADNLRILSTLQGVASGFTSYQVNFLNDRRVNIKRALASLRDGLINHFSQEEVALLALVGEPLMKVIRKEHQEILDDLAELDWMLLNISPVGMLFNSVFLQQKVDALCRLLNSNCIRENSVLELLISLPDSTN